MGDALDRVRLPVRPVVHGVDAPRVARARMLGVQDAIHDRIAQVHIGRGHVDLGAQHARAIGKLAVFHALEQVQVLLDRAIAVRAVLARLGQRPAVLADLVGAQIVDIRLAGFDQLDSPVVQLLEVIRGEEQPVFPVRAQPFHIVGDRVDVFLLFLGGIGIVEAQVELATVFLRRAVVDPDRLGVADV